MRLILPIAGITPVAATEGNAPSEVNGSSGLTLSVATEAKLKAGLKVVGSAPSSEYVGRAGDSEIIDRVNAGTFKLGAPTLGACMLGTEIEGSP